MEREPRRGEKEIVMSILFVFGKEKENALEGRTPSHSSIYKWVPPTGKVVNPCRVTDMDCRKDLHGIFLYSTSRVSLCWVKKKIATQQAV